MNLELIVPTLETCKRIPQGSFYHSALAWEYDTWGAEYRVIPRTARFDFPAPTLAEILAELPEAVRVKASNNCIKHDDIDEVFHDKNLATAAMRLWFRLKGVQG